MIRSRVFRSGSFWLGLMGLVFMLWAWADSMEYRSGLSSDYAALSSNCRLGFVGQGSGGLEVEWFQGDNTRSATAPFGDIHATRYYHPAGNAFPAPSIQSWNFPGLRAGWKYFPSSRISYSLVLPHWLLILFYLPTWAGVLVWRWKAASKRDAGWDAQAKGEAP